MAVLEEVTQAIRSAAERVGPAGVGLGRGWGRRPGGASGGPPVDPDGLVLGLNAVRMEGGLIVALPADAALRERADGLTRGETPVRPRLGVAIAPAYIARRLRRAVGLPEREGLLVRWVEEGGPADQAGIEKGDLIVSAAGEPVARVDDLQPRVEAAAGDELDLTLVRGIEEREVTVSLQAEAAVAGLPPRPGPSRT